MKFYKIENSTNLKEIGIYPQVQEASYNCDPFEDKEFIENIGYKKIDFTPKLPFGILHKKAKLTDYLSAVPNGYTRRLLISNELKNNLPNENNYQLFKADIKTGVDNLENYWFLNPINFDYGNIDFQKSEFYLMESVFDKVKKLEINNVEDLEKNIEEVYKMRHPFRLRITEIKIKGTKNNDFLIIDNVKGGIGYYISEELKNKLEKNKITGINFSEI